MDLYTMQTPLVFGKHKTKTVGEILESDPTYIRWCLKNIPTFRMSKQDETLVLSRAKKHDKSKYDDYYGAIDVYDYCD